MQTEVVPRAEPETSNRFMFRNGQDRSLQIGLMVCSCPRRGRTSCARGLNMTVTPSKHRAPCPGTSGSRLPEAGRPSVYARRCRPNDYVRCPEFDYFFIQLIIAARFLADLFDQVLGLHTALCQEVDLAAASGSSRSGTRKRRCRPGSRSEPSSFPCGSRR